MNGRESKIYDTRLGRHQQQQSAMTNYEETVKTLNRFYSQLKVQILQFQSSTLGLFPQCGCAERARVAHVRESIYCAVAVWSLSQAYKRVDDDEGKTHELAQSAVKTMRGILYCWMHQTIVAQKVEKFKQNQGPNHALHCVFDMVTGDSVYEDHEYQHLQIDLVALYLIFLVEMISSGLQIIFTTDEVDFIQNLVFYVERAYRTPDYGMWERGSKYNNGSTEIHASSIGLAKAALEAISGMNLFGEQGAAWSVIYIDIDAHNRNRTIFETILPRESNSKNTDASLIPTITWPAFGIHESESRDRTLSKVLRKLNGKYGFKRYLRDGYKTKVEDSQRKYYKPAEIKNFDNIECEWPMFYCYLMIDCCFKGDKAGMEKYDDILKPLLKQSTEYGILVPKYYYVPLEKIDEEKKYPGSQTRVESPEGSDKGVFMWGQAVYFIAQLLKEGILNINELDPIRRYLPAPERPRFSARYSAFQGTPGDLVIQFVLITESGHLQQLLDTYGIHSQTPRQIEPIEIWSPKELSKAYEYLGINTKLGLTGRPNRPFGVLSTSKIYRACGRTVLCYPLLFDLSDFYLAEDMSVVVDDCKSDLAFLSKCWKLAGRPTFCMIIREDMVRGAQFYQILNLLAELKRGNCNGIRVRMGRLQSMISSACIEHLDFLYTLPDPSIFHSFEEVITGKKFKSLLNIPKQVPSEEMQTFNYQNFSDKSTLELVQMTRYTDDIDLVSQMLQVILDRGSFSYRIDEYTVEDYLERLVHQAATKKRWHTVRFCSALLCKVVDSLAPSVTSILVRGKQVTVGVFGHDELVIDKPLNPSEIKKIMYACCAHDLYEAVLQQELILSIGKLIATEPQLFYGILKIRIGWFVHAMKTELNQNPSWPVKDIGSLSPSQLKKLLLLVLTWNLNQESDDVEEGKDSFRTPLMRRHLDGSLNRVPKTFYDRVWQILERTPNGIKVVGYHLPQQPTISDMTMYEMNFSLLVEQMLSRIVDPAYRQMMVETFMVVSTILERNPELSFPQAVNMDKILEDAFMDYKNELGEELQSSCMMHTFINTPANVKHGTTSYIAQAVLRQVFDGELKQFSDYSCIIT